MAIPGLSRILGNDTLQQIVLWNLAGSAVGAALSPYLNELTATVNTATPLARLSPEAAAEAVLRNVMGRDQAAAEAAAAGINGERFDVLAKLAGNAPDPTSLAIALRRGLIDQGRYLDGIRQGRLRDEWADLVKALAVQQPSPNAMLEAYLEGQVTEGEARAQWAKLGGDPDYFDVLYNTQGQAPSPVQAADMANRGLIPWSGSGAGVVSFEQAFLEGPWRNKWLEPFRKAATYIPPPRTITAMYGEGTLTRDQAIKYLEANGLDATLAAAYVSAGSSQATKDTKDLARSTITTLYRDRLVTRANASAMLESLGYATDEANFILAVEDVRVVQAYMASAVGRVHTLYVGHKLSRDQAISVLAQLEVPPETVPDLVQVWDYERAANVRTLTPSEIASAYKLQLLDQATAQLQLQELGYQPHDAWTYLSIHAKGPLPDEPPADAVNPAP